MSTFSTGVEYHARLVNSPRGRAAAELAAALRWEQQAKEQGLTPLGKPRHEWVALTDAQIAERSKVSVGVNGRPDEPALRAATSEQIEAEEERRVEFWARTVVCRTYGEVDGDLSDDDGPGGLSGAARAQVLQMGREVLAEQQASVVVCGGALRRHSFTPRDAAWLRDATIQQARCGNCERDVTRAELIALQTFEQRFGTCPGCGRPLDPSRKPSGCPVCGAP